MTRHRGTWAAVVVALMAAACSSAGADVTPQACEQQLTTATFRVCLPDDADMVVPGDATAAATVGDQQVHLVEQPAQPGDPDQAAFAALADLQEQVGRSLSLTHSANPVTMGEEGPLDVAGADGAFQSLSAVYDGGEVDDTVAWGRALTVGERVGAVLVVHPHDGDEEITDQQLEQARAAAMPIVVTLAPR